MCTIVARSVYNDTLQYELRLKNKFTSFSIDDLYEDTNGEGRLHELNIPSMLAVKATKIG